MPLVRHHVALRGPLMRRRKAPGPRLYAPTQRATPSGGIANEKFSEGGPKCSIIWLRIPKDDHLPLRETGGNARCWQGAFILVAGTTFTLVDALNPANKTST